MSYYDHFLTRKPPFFALFILSRTSDNTASQNIGGPMHGPSPPPQILGGSVPPVPPRSPPLITRHAICRTLVGCCSYQRQRGAGFGFGPSSFDILASDLHPLHQRNSIAKYADDTYLIVPASARSSVRMELDHISSWAKLNNLRLNKTKSRELLIHGRRSFQPRPHLTDVERVTTMKVLGVTLRDDLNASTHITEILAECSRSMYICTPHITISWTTYNCPP